MEPLLDYEFMVSVVPALLRVLPVTLNVTVVSISLALPGQPIGVKGDTHHLVRLFTNLLENAARHTPGDGAIRVVARGDGETVTVSVEDTGEGIAPEHLPHVCERFYRVDSARSRAHGGTGLGLAICESIVQAHGGSLAIDSEIGRGTTVTVRLPQATLAPEPELATVNRDA